MRIENLADARTVLEATGNNPYARGSMRAPSVRVRGWRSGAVVAWLGTDAEERRTYVSVLGTPPAAAALLDAVADQLPSPARATVPRGTAAWLTGRATLPAYDDWDFRWTGTRPPPQAQEGRVDWLDGDRDGEAVAALLDVASPGASARPGDPAVRRWAGVLGQGGLEACAADTSGAPGVGHLSSVATAPECRGRGLSAALCAWLIGRLLEEEDVVTLGHYTANEAGRRLYDRLGLAHGHAFSSGRLVRQ